VPVSSVPSWPPECVAASAVIEIFPDLFRIKYHPGYRSVLVGELRLYLKISCYKQDVFLRYGKDGKHKVFSAAIYF
ncbi:hypothetical protein MKW92_003579, partial [Papaver armeniacum]